jgi:hypothetical protein
MSREAKTPMDHNFVKKYYFENFIETSYKSKILENSPAMPSLFINLTFLQIRILTTFKSIGKKIILV